MVDEDGELLASILSKPQCASVAGNLIVKLNKAAKRPDIETDIISILDKYTVHLSTARVFLRNGVFNTNFAEAALLLQTATNIYSKKVDLLWDCVIGYQFRMTSYEEKTEENAQEFNRVEERKERYKRKRKKKEPPPEPPPEPEPVVEPPLDPYQTYEDNYSCDEIDQLLATPEEDIIPQIYPNFFDLWDTVNKEEYLRGRPKKSRFRNPVIVPDDMKRLRLKTPPLPQTYDAGRRDLRIGIYEIDEFDGSLDLEFTIDESYHYHDMDEADLANIYYQYVCLKTKPENIVNPNRMEHALDIFLNKMTAEELEANPTEFLEHWRNEVKELAAELRLRQIKTMLMNRRRQGLGGLPESIMRKYGLDEEDAEITQINQKPLQQTDEQGIRKTINSRTDSGFFSHQSCSEIDIIPTPVNVFENLDDSGILMDVPDDDNVISHVNVVEIIDTKDNNNMNVGVNVTVDEATKAIEGGKVTVEDATTIEGGNMTVLDDANIVESGNVTVEEEVVVRCKRIRKRKSFDDYDTINEDLPVTPRKRREILRPTKVARVKDFEKFFFENYKSQVGEGALIEPVYEESDDDDDDSNDVIMIGVSEEVVITSVADEAIQVIEAAQNAIVKLEPADEVAATEETQVVMAVEEITAENNVIQTEEAAQVTETDEELIQRLLDEDMERSRHLRETTTVTETELGARCRRYSEWQHLIDKKVGKRRTMDFDIHAEGTKILDAIPEINGTASYESMCQGKTPGQVAISFIAMLQLANTENIDFLGVKEGELSNKTLQIKLLSRRRHHEELAQYNAPSEESLHERMMNVQSMSRKRSDDSMPSTSKGFPKRTRLENPEMESLMLELNANSDYPNLKREIKNVFGITDEDAKVIKIRNKQHALIPMMSLLDSKEDQSPFIIDITNIAVASESRSNLLQDAYLDAVRQKMRSMESRVCQAEVLLPQLQWRRQSHLDHTVNTLSSRVAFLNRRIDELMPAEWKSKMPETIS